MVSVGRNWQGRLGRFGLAIQSILRARAVGAAPHCLVPGPGVAVTELVVLGMRPPEGVAWDVGLGLVGLYMKEANMV